MKVPLVPYSEELKAYLEVLFTRFSPRFVILYGSVAKGDFGVGSDVDLLVVSEDFPENFDERLKMLFALNPTTAPIEPVGYTPKEFEELLKRRHATALYALDEGIPLYDDGLYLKMKKQFERLKKELDIVKVEGGWQARKIIAECLRDYCDFTSKS